MMAWKLGPLFATGCTSVMKCAEQTPLTNLRMGELVHEAGFPNGVLNLLTGYGEPAGRPLSQHPMVDKVAFTGSVSVGKEILKNAAYDGIKRVTLELGGKSANIVCPDADMDVAVAASHQGLYFNLGQSCIAASRTFVHESIYDEFVAKSVEHTKKLRVGSPFEAGVYHGPQIDADQKGKVMGFIKSGKDQGANVVLGGNAPDLKGHFVNPTIFSDVTDDMTIAKEEIFGPVMSILKYKTYDEAIRRANDTTFGLAACVCSQNVETVHYLTSKLKAGTVFVNMYYAGNAWNTPFGGYKNSGLGRELGEEGLHNYLENKTVIMRGRPLDMV